MSLPAREQRILVGIEDELTRDDPALAGLLAHPSAAAVGHTRLRSPALLGLLVVVPVVLLLLLVLTYPLIAPSGPAAVGLLTAVLVVPWMVAAARGVAPEPTPQSGQGPSAHQDADATPIHRGGGGRKAATRTRRTGPLLALPIGLALGAVAAPLALGAVEMALTVVTLLLLAAAHVLRWRARRVLFRRWHDSDAAAEPGRTGFAPSREKDRPSAGHRPTAPGPRPDESRQEPRTRSNRSRPSATTRPEGPPE